MTCKRMLLIALLLIMNYSALSSPLTAYYRSQHPDQTQLAFVGDILLHRPLVVQSKTKGFIQLWRQALPYLKQADIAVANLEGPIASQVDRRGRIVQGKSPWDPPISTSYPRFNYPPALAPALYRSHFNIAITANNHAFDRFSIGVDKTVAILKQHHLIPLGSRIKGQPQTPWYRITHTKGFTIAWIACTDSLNGLKDQHHQVLRCDQRWGRRIIISLIHQLKNKVDSIVVLPHWGNEYQQRPNRFQRHFATSVLNAGAMIVIGTHPHVMQPFKQYRTPDHRLTFIAYSLGNFVSNQGTPTNRASVILLVSLGKQGHRTVISSIRYQPIYMQNRLGRHKIHLMVLHKRAQHPFAWRFIHGIVKRKT